MSDLKVSDIGALGNTIHWLSGQVEQLNQHKAVLEQDILAKSQEIARLTSELNALKEQEPKKPS